MEFPVMSRASGQARPSVHRFSGTATAAMARTFAAWSRVRRPKQPAAYARKVLLNRHLLERPSPDGPPRHASGVIAAGPARWSHPLPAVPSACPSQRIRAVTSGQRRLVEVGPYLAFGVGAGAALPHGRAFQARDAGSIPVTPLHRPPSCTACGTASSGLRRPVDVDRGRSPTSTHHDDIGCSAEPLLSRCTTPFGT
jgi:hypothetical protein